MTNAGFSRRARGTDGEPTDETSVFAKGLAWLRFVLGGEFMGTYCLTN